MHRFALSCSCKYILVTCIALHETWCAKFSCGLCAVSSFWSTCRWAPFGQLAGGLLLVNLPVGSFWSTCRWATLSCRPSFSFVCIAVIISVLLLQSEKQITVTECLPEQPCDFQPPLCYWSRPVDRAATCTSSSFL